MAWIRNSLALICTVVLFYSDLTIGQETPLQSDEPTALIQEILSNPATNKIPYFDNRFRIDAEIDQVTMLFFRKHGTMPVILVRPDGSKFRANQYPEEKVTWYDDQTYDMITIRKPMPGPWQVLGDIDKTSQIMVITDIELHAEPLPEVVIAGETLKVKAHVTNGGQNITVAQFNDVIRLMVDFQSTNNSDYDNFGSGIFKITEFQDNGVDLDEYSRDGVFTGEFTLEIPPGEWQPVYTVILPNVTREVRPNKVILQRNPISLSIEKTSTEGENHKVSFTVGGDFIKKGTVVFQGKIVYPDRYEKPFSILKSEIEEFHYEFVYRDTGVHRVRVNAFGEMQSGREFMLKVPEFVFNVEPPPPPEPEPTEEELAELEQFSIAAELVELPMEEETDDSDIWIYIVITNLVILLLVAFGYIGYLFYKQKQSAKALKS